MVAEAPWTVRAAQRVVGLVDDIVNLALATMQEMGTHHSERPITDPLAGFRRATKVGATGAKWSIVGVIVAGALLMLGAAIVLPRSQPIPPPRAIMAPAHPAPSTPVTNDRAMIAARCKAGAYRAFPEIEGAECAGRPTHSPAHKGGMK